MRPNRNEVRGKINEATGRVKQAAGRINNDPLLEEEGADQRAGGQLEAGLGKARRKVGEAVKDLGKKLGR